jgi:hypothetical protein
VKHGFDPGKIDGIMGPKTHAALEKFQTAKGIVPITGGPDKQTTDALARPAVSLADLHAPNIAVGTPRWAVSELQRLGLSRLDAIALTANLVWESGGHDHINWSAHGDNNHSHGAGQWNDRHERFSNLQELAASRGTTWDDPATQLQHMVNELKSTEVNAMRRMEKANTLHEKMEAALTYWRPSIPHADKREAIASKLDKEISDA